MTENNSSPRMSTTNKKNETQNTKNKQEQPTRSVMFVPHTLWSVLAKMLREKENKISKLASKKMKIVECAGVKLQDILTRSNPSQSWSRPILWSQIISVSDTVSILRLR